MEKLEIVRAWLECGTVLSSQGGQLILGWGKRTWSSLSSHSPSNPSFYFPDFFLEAEKPWFTHAHTCEVDVEELLTLLKRLSPNKPPLLEWKNPDKSHFERTFEELKSKFSAREIDKAVPYLFAVTSEKMGHDQRITSLLALLNYTINNPAHLYGFWAESEGILGATPEILFKFIDTKTLETVACAGTVGESRDASALLTDPKELHEHQLVVEGIKEALTSFGRVEVMPSHLLKLSRLVHLATPIMVKLANHSFTYSQIVNALHPTPALGTFPKEKGARWLKAYQLEMQRGRFGAPCGVLFPDLAKSSCYVSIRNVQWSAQGMRIGAGCGVVAESQCELEWAEINLKLRAIKEMLAL